MDKERDKLVLNELLVDLFNDILQIEQHSIKNEKLNDISITEVHTIEAIGIHNTKSMSEVAQLLGITVGTLTTAVGHLERKGYVERKKQKEDKRVVLVSLTDKGELVFKLHERFHKNMVHQIISGIDDNQREVLIAGLSRLNKFFKKKYDLTNSGIKEKNNV